MGIVAAGRCGVRRWVHVPYRGGHPRARGHRSSCLQPADCSGSSAQARARTAQGLYRGARQRRVITGETDGPCRRRPAQHSRASPSMGVFHKTLNSPEASRAARETRVAARGLRRGTRRGLPPGQHESPPSGRACHRFDRPWVDDRLQAVVEHHVVLLHQALEEPGLAVIAVSLASARPPRLSPGEVASPPGILPRHERDEARARFDRSVPGAWVAARRRSRQTADQTRSRRFAGRQFPNSASTSSRSPSHPTSTVDAAASFVRCVAASFEASLRRSRLK